MDIKFFKLGLQTTVDWWGKYAVVNGNYIEK